jgi:hypothetical protein
MEDIGEERIAGVPHLDLSVKIVDPIKVTPMKMTSPGNILESTEKKPKSAIANIRPRISLDGYRT